MKNREIERLRAWAILMVLMQHLPRLKDTMFPFMTQGGAGVHLFFVISGYVVARSLLRTFPEFSDKAPLLERVNMARPALAAFMLRRIYRILPMALLWALVPFACAWWLEGWVGDDPPPMFRELFAILTLQYNYAFAGGNGGRLGWYWSLAVEEHFYLILPLFMVIFASRSRRIVAAAAGIALVAFVLRPYVPFTGPPDLAWAWNFTSHRNFDFLFAGVLIYLLREQGFLEMFRTMPRGWALVLAYGSLFGVWFDQGLMPSGHFFGSGQIVLEALAAMAVLQASFERGIVLEIPGLKRVLEWLGSRSYGVYLIHGTIIYLGDTLTGRAGMPVLLLRSWGMPARQTFMALAPTFVLAELCFRYLETPLLARGHRIAAAVLKSSRPAPVLEIASG